MRTDGWWQESKVAPKDRDNYEPESHDRVWYRHKMTGDRGYFVRRDGESFIRLDRPNEEILKPFGKRGQGEWMPEKEHRPYTRAQLAKVAYEADKALCFLLGRHEDSRIEWESLFEQERIRFIHKGPVNEEPERIKVYRAVMEALLHLEK